MGGRKEKSFLLHSEGKTEESGAKRMRMCKESCGFLGALKSLLRHSVSTGATSITIRFDLEYPYLQIADNGVGISRSEISKIGKTTFLDLITAAEEVLIETMTESMEKSTVMKFHNKVLLEEPQNTKVPKDGGGGTETFDWLHSSPPLRDDTPKAISCTAESPRHKRYAAGTTFTLTNVQLSIMERFEKFGKNIVNYVKSFAIAHYQMSITLKNLKGNKLLFGSKKAKSITEKVTSIYNLDGMEFNSMTKASSNIAIEAFWGTKLHRSSNIQLVFINGEPSTNTRLLKTIKKAWRCGAKKKYPIYILCITIRIAHNENIDQLSADSVIKDCIRECVGKFRSTRVEDELSDDDDLGKDEGSIYFRSNLLLDAGAHKKESTRKKVHRERSPSVVAMPLDPPPHDEGWISPPVRTVQQERPKTPPRPTLNHTVTCRTRSPRQYLHARTPTQLTMPSIIATVCPQPPQFRSPEAPVNQSAFISHLEDQTRRLQSQVQYLQSAMAVVDELRESRERDRRRIEELTRENQELLFSQRSTRTRTPSRVADFSNEQFRPVGNELMQNPNWGPRQSSTGTINIYNSQVTVLNGPHDPPAAHASAGQRDEFLF